MYDSRECFVSGKRTNGRFAVKSFDGSVSNGGVSYKKLVRIAPASGWLVERRSVVGNVVSDC